MTAMVAEWVKTLVLQIQVASVLFRVFIRSSIKSLAVNVTSNQEISLWILMFYDFGNYFNVYGLVICVQVKEYKLSKQIETCLFVGGGHCG